MTSPDPGSDPALVLPRPPDHRQGSAPGLGAQLPRHDPAAAVFLAAADKRLQDHPPDARTISPSSGSSAFLRYLEEDRGNHIRTRNQRLAAVHTLFDYIARREPGMLAVCQRVAAIPIKRAGPAETRFLEQRRDRPPAAPPAPRPGGSRCATAPCCCSSTTPAHARRKSPTCASNTSTSASTRLVRLHGKGDKWRTCPLWQQTARLLDAPARTSPDRPTGHRRRRCSSRARPGR